MTTFFTRNINENMNRNTLIVSVPTMVVISSPNLWPIASALLRCILLIDLLSELVMRRAKMKLILLAVVHSDLSMSL